MLLSISIQGVYTPSKMGVNGFGFPLSPAPSPVPSIRQLQIHSPRATSTIDDREQHIVETFCNLDAVAKGRVLKQLLSSAPRDALLDAQSVISPRLRHDPFKMLPLELSLRILSYVQDPKSLAAAAQVSRLWYFLLSDDSTWKQLCKDHHFRRLSAAGSYVHRWNEFKDRAASQAVEETPEAEEITYEQEQEQEHEHEHEHEHRRERGPGPGMNNNAHSPNSMANAAADACETDQYPSVSPRSMTFFTVPQSLNFEAPSQHHEARQVQDQGPRDDVSEQGQVDEVNERHERAREYVSIESSQPPRMEPTHPLRRRHNREVVPIGTRRTDPRRNSLLGNQFGDLRWTIGTAHANEPLIQYGSRLPNFDSEMQQRLNNAFDSSHDPIGEAFYDPSAFITNPPDSYRSHFRQQYLLNQAWAQGGQLAGRYSLPDHEGAIVTTVIMQDGFIVIALDTSLILVFNEDGKLLRSLYGHVMGVWALALKGHTLLSGGCDRDVREWDLNSGLCRKILRGHSSTVRCLAMASSKLALSGGRDAVIRVWDLEDGKSLYRLVGHTGSVRRLEVTQVDGTTYAVSASYDCTAKVWNIDNGTLVHTLAGHSNQIYSLAVDNGRIATGSLDHTICVWDLRSGAKLSTLLGHSALVGQLSLKNDTLVSGGSDGALRIWDMARMTCAHRIAAHDNTVTCLRLTGDRIITGGPDCCVQIWNARSGERVRQLQKPSISTVWGIAASEDRLLTVYSEGPSIVIELMSFAPV